jgi:hypothetical protein
VEPLTLAPAFGRDYRRHQDVIDAWNRGESFALISAFGQRFFDKENSKGLQLWVSYNRGRTKSRLQ